MPIDKSDDCINIKGSETRRQILKTTIVEKCNVCNESIPITNVRRGEEYVRCSCNSLFSSKQQLSKGSCVKSDCKQIIKACRSCCTQCNDTCVYKILNKIVPHCRHCPKFRQSAQIIAIKSLPGITAIFCLAFTIIFTPDLYAAITTPHWLTIAFVSMSIPLGIIFQIVANHCAEMVRANKFVKRR